MAEKTSKKRPAKPFRGAIDGKPFSKENQPSPEAKSNGWKERRSEMLLSKAIAEALGVTADDQTPLKGYAAKLILLAENGNAEAMKQIRSAVEDVVEKVDVTSNGEGITNPLDLLIKKGGKITIQGE